MMCTGRSGCERASFSYSFDSNGAYIESQSCFPRALISPRFSSVGVREGFVDSCEATSRGRDPWNALRQLIVRGIPLKLMHFRPTSRISSAVDASVPAFCAEATLWRTDSESGEFRVNVAAVYESRPLSVTGTANV